MANKRHAHEISVLKQEHRHDLKQLQANQDHARRIELDKKKRLLLDEATDKLNAFSDAEADFRALLTDLVVKRENGQTVSDDDKQNWQVRNDAFREAFKDFSDIEGKLLLAELKAINVKFREYASDVEALYKEGTFDTSLSSEQLRNYREVIRTHRTELLIALGKAYRMEDQID